MSSVQDRIRKLQSLDSATPAAPPPGAVAAAKQRLTTQTSLPATVTARSRQFAESADATAAPAVASVSSLAHAVENTSLSTSAPRVGQVAAEFSARESAAARTSGGSNAAASIISRLESQGDVEEVRDRVKRLERDKPGMLGKGPLPANALDGRRSAFERDSTEGTTHVKDKAAAFASEEARKDNAERLKKEREAQVEEGKKTVIRKKDEKREDLKAGSGLSERFAMFEAGNKGIEESTANKNMTTKTREAEKPTPKPVVKSDASAVGAREMPKPNADKKATGKASAVEELREVKKLNEELLRRLVELTGAFKRLEKNREELQRKVAKLESK